MTIELCNNCKKMPKYFDYIEYLKMLMKEAIKDFHGKSVLFSASFLEEAEKENQPGDHILTIHCPGCGKELEVFYGDDEGEIGVVG